MKILLKSIGKSLLLLAILLNISCEKYITKVPLDGFTAAQVYSDLTLAQSYLYDTYNFLPVGFNMRNAEGMPDEYHGNSRWGGGEFILYTTDLMCDNARNKSDWPPSVVYFLRGFETPTTSAWNNWKGSYKAIRKANILIAGLNDDSPIIESEKSRMISEARMIRAFLYFRLGRRFGNIPVVTEAVQFELEGDYHVAQSTRSEVYEFVVSELKDLYPDLPTASQISKEDWGRFSQEAVWALLGRVYLFYASSDEGNAIAHYTESAKYSQMVMDSDYGFDLDPDFSGYFQKQNTMSSKETIFEILSDGVNKYHAWDFFASSGFYGGHSQFLPSQELVDEFETINGLAIADDPDYNPQDPYANRDPRLAHTVVYHGMQYKGRTTDHSEHYTVSGTGDTTWTSLGDDLVISPYTSYWTKKHVNLSSEVADEICVQSWKEFRYGEVLLNYAEAANHVYGATGEVYDALDKVRERAGIPALSDVRPGLTQTEMVEEILHERRVELAFENHRYWDLFRYRRSHTQPGVINGVRVITNDDTGEVTYKVIPYDFNPKHELHFPERYYFLPIPQEVIDADPLIRQNPGYEGVVFEE